MTFIADAPLGITGDQGAGFALEGTAVLEHLRYVCSTSAENGAPATGVTKTPLRGGAPDIARS